MAVALMGILNVTPDSFSDGGQFSSVAAVEQAAHKMVEEGARYLDIGGVSTRPGSHPVTVEEEWLRLSPYVRSIARSAILSVDTFNAQIAEKSCELGARIVNDVSGGASDDMWRVVASSGASIVVMHSTSGTPHVFNDGALEGVIDRVCRFYEVALGKAESFGVPEDRVILDPGMGAFLSSSPQPSILVLKGLERLLANAPRILIGISRKGFLKVFRPSASNLDRDAESAALSVAALMRTPSVWDERKELILRVHNVALHTAAVAMAREFRLNVD